MGVQEYRRKCKVCGKIWCYTDEDVKASLSNATSGLIASVGALANYVGGSSYKAFEMQKRADRNIDKMHDFTICPECHSRDNEPYYTEEDKIRMAEEEKRAAEEAKRKEEEMKRAEEEAKREAERKAEELKRAEEEAKLEAERRVAKKEAYWIEHKAEKEALIAKKEYAKKKMNELGRFAKKEKQELENLIKAIDYELERERD